MGWGWRHYLLLLAFNGVLIGLAMGLHYGHLHHETEEPAAREASSEATQWDDVRDGFIESCAAQTPVSREQCTCTFEWWEQNVSLSGYLDISNAMITGRPLSDEQAQLVARSGAHCAR